MKIGVIVAMSSNCGLEVDFFQYFAVSQLLNPSVKNHPGAGNSSTDTIS